MGFSCHLLLNHYLWRREGGKEGERGSVVCVREREEEGGIVSERERERERERVGSSLSFSQTEEEDCGTKSSLFPLSLPPPPLLPFT